MLFGSVPLALLLAVREDPRRYGLGLEDTRRGLLLLGVLSAVALLRAVGPLGVVIAVVPFAFMHIGKPDPEMLSTLGGGLVFGWLNWRTGSIWSSGIYHVLIHTTVILAAAGWAAAG